MQNTYALLSANSQEAKRSFKLHDAFEIASRLRKEENVFRL